MQRPYFIPALAALTLVLAVPAVAPAAPVVKGPPTFHARFVEDFVDDDFCGTGASVSVHVEGRATVWEGEDAFRELLILKESITHDGVTLVNQFAGRTVAVPVPVGVEVIETGLRARLKLSNGRVLIADHGLLHTLVLLDEEGEFLGLEILRDRGGHPIFASEGELWCQAATAAFGLPFPG
jgi:hypothetical protein